MDKNTLIASVQYGDFAGTSAADRHDDHTKAEKLAAKYGISLKDKFVFGFHLRYGENRTGLPAGNRVRLSFLCAAVAGGSFDGIQEMVTANNGNLPYEELDISVTLEEAFDLFKRVDIVLLNPLKTASYTEI